MVLKWFLLPLHFLFFEPPPTKNLCMLKFNDISTAPDIMVAIARPRGHRGSYKQWA